MCRKLLWLIALLGIASVASAAATGVDDFESYWGQPAIETAWVDNSQPMNTAQPLLMTDTPAQGTAYMDFDWSISGGWANPTDPTDLGVQNQAALSYNASGPWDLASYGSGLELHITIDPGTMGSPSGIDFYLLQFMQAGQAAQAWIPSVDWMAGTGPWWAPSDELMGYVGNSATTFVDPGWWPAGKADWLNAQPAAISGQWTELVLRPDGFIWYTWSGWATGIADMNNVTDIQLYVFTTNRDNTGASGPYRLDSTGGTVWPLGPNAGTMSVDDIYLVPEPATIALLGLGGLALLRRRR
jgi:hypothetical protein